MSPQGRRRHMVVWSSSAGPSDRYGTSASVRTRRKGRVRRLVRIGGLLTVIGLMGAFRVARSRRRPLTGLVIAALAVILRDSMWGFLFSIMFLLYLPPWSPQSA
jgi:hypothetical protein